MQLDAATLELLRCPMTQSKLTLEDEELVAAVGGLRYPVRDGIPVLLVEEAGLPEGFETLDALREKLKADGHAVRA
ncbi:MAG: Trm112 family protein [Planctomycetota bacterium]